MVKILFSISFICSLLLHAPVFGQIADEYYGFIKKADSLFRLKEYRVSADMFSAAFKTLGWKGFERDRYKAACAWAYAGVPDSALFNIERIAFRLGFSDYAGIAGDSVLGPLTRQRKWDKTMERIKHNADIEPERLNERRKSVGLSSIEEYIELMNSTYHGALREKE